MLGQYRRGPGGRNWRTSAPKKVETPSPPYGTLLKSIEVKDLDGESTSFSQTATITDSRLVASYNWVDGNTVEPTILVPGKPPRWTPLTEAMNLAQDSGEYFRDKNAARYPKHPMEPAVLALLATDPAVRTKLDVIGCGSTIGNLLRFVRGKDKPFRMLVELVQDTVFFIRRENSPTELLHDVYGYGHTFPEVYTSWEPDVKGSASHQRLVRYSFGGLQLIVRFEGDGYLAKSPSSSEASQDASVDDLISGLPVAANISEKVSSGTKLKVQRAGEVVDQDFIFDLKTRSVNKKNDQDTLGEELPRMWVSQIPNFILAYHTRGVFHDIEVSDVHQDVEEWEKTHNQQLSKLAALIHRIIVEVRGRPDGKLELCNDGSGELEFREQRSEAGDALSVETKALWVKDVDSDEPDIVWAADDDYTACTESCGYCGQCTY
ncbi:geranylgeranyl pyrophosphate synthetase [Eremomyces bilateralis CBS 781.70]|uniref:Geranylgeranyl pyrophosphate synthetase n=1 Tax=Eremomyces bilateralis CBS 781.70 TaxID=1392243 RepID=A0A6G1G7J0_9PEZI|nr:geranylgeranyl pyrophosphate synthetase [Eremomyces bilateralis CBS 781.70]KAF1814037.1 geranylgeranyl pyrophosphate synthetase [Eremomyces bilateralis CBS 781.70]